MKLVEAFLNLCPYCRTPNYEVDYEEQLHKVDRSFGPFQLFNCRSCGSLATANPPNLERLANFYQNYDSHRPEWYTSASSAQALDPQYYFYARRIINVMTSDTASWLELGVGHGEVANRVLALKPQSFGSAIDIGERPSSLANGIEYTSVDINDPTWLSGIRKSFDLVYAVAVWEHLLDPFAFAKSCLSLVAPGGLLILITPDASSLAYRVLSRKWPYFQPGEHLSIPSRKGAELILKTAACELDANVTIEVEPIWVGYSIRYALEVVRLSPVARLFPAQLVCPMPTGVLEARVRKDP